MLNDDYPYYHELIEFTYVSILQDTPDPDIIDSLLDCYNDYKYLYES